MDISPFTTHDSMQSDMYVFMSIAILHVHVTVHMHELNRQAHLQDTCHTKGPFHGAHHQAIYSIWPGGQNVAHTGWQGGQLLEHQLQGTVTCWHNAGVLGGLLVAAHLSGGRVPTSPQ